MITGLLDVLFGCWHKNYSFPMTRQGQRGPNHGMYVVCLDCGKEFAYDWSAMKVVPPVTATEPRPALAKAADAYAGK